MSCLHLLECHTACYWAFPPLTALILPLQKNLFVYHLRLLILKWLQIYTEQAFWHQEIIFPSSLKTISNYSLLNEFSYKQTGTATQTAPLHSNAKRVLFNSVIQKRSLDTDQEHWAVDYDRFSCWQPKSTEQKQSRSQK